MSDKRYRSRSNSVLSEEEKKFIFENYSSMTNKQLSDAIGKTDRQIRGYANGMGLKKSYKKPPFEKWQKDYINEWYNIKDNAEIGEYIGLTTKQVNDYGYKNIGARNIERYMVNEDYFKIIDTEDKAYWLGFLYADGCVHEDTSRGYVKAINMELGLAYKDVNHLRKFNTSIESNNPIKDKIVKLDGKEYKCCKVTINNTNFCKWLIKQKCLPNKSLILEFPNEDIISENLVHHFIRGYFDGDGCVSHHSETAKHKSYRFGFVGTMHFLSTVQDILNCNIGISKTNIYGKGNAFQCAWGGRENCRKFYEYIYKDATIYLDRKHEKFIKIINKDI